MSDHPPPTAPRVISGATAAPDAAAARRPPGRRRCRTPRSPGSPRCSPVSPPTSAGASRARTTRSATPSSPSSPRATCCSRTSRASARRAWPGRWPSRCPARGAGCSSRPTCCRRTSPASRSTTRRTREFEFHPGPIFANIVIGDEINRASPKTQSAMLEVMEERRVTVDGVPHPVPRPFVVVATQNPIEMDAGTYALPEAQLDRFLLKMAMGYPDAAAEAGIVTARHGGVPGPLEPVLELEEIERMITVSANVRTDPQIVQYVVGLVHATRHTADVRLGASPRGSIGLLRAAQTLAAAEGRAVRHRRRHQAPRRPGARPPPDRRPRRPAARHHRRPRHRRPPRPPDRARRSHRVGRRAPHRPRVGDPRGGDPDDRRRRRCSGSPPCSPSGSCSSSSSCWRRRSSPRCRRSPSSARPCPARSSAADRPRSGCASRRRRRGGRAR